MGGKKNRLDLEMVKRVLAPSKEKAKAIIMSGQVRVNGQQVDKADAGVSGADVIEVLQKFPFVSRGGLKIKRAISDFSLDLRGLKILDIGISTGGFSDFVLKNGAGQVAGVDVNTDQVDFNLRRDPRLVLIKKNARHLNRDDIPFDPDLITIDVSFISILKILPVLKQFTGAQVVALIKPQFESERGQVSKGGVVRKDEQRLHILLTLKHRIEKLGFSLLAFTLAGVRGRKGNQEYFFLLGYGQEQSIDDTIIVHAEK